MKTSCREVRRELANYMEDDISAELKARIDRHFQECDGCSSIYDGTRRIVKLMGKAGILIFPKDSLFVFISGL